jgi:AAA domain
VTGFYADGLHDALTEAHEKLRKQQMNGYGRYPGDSDDKSRPINDVRKKPANGFDATTKLPLLTLAGWLKRDILLPDFMLGEFLSTTTRAMLIGPTGLGKTNFLIALGLAIADGKDFLHWRGCGQPRRVLFIDGEMSRRQAKKRIVDAASRHGNTPTTFYYLNREDFPDMASLNTEAGQHFINGIIEALGGIDLIILDNVQALLSGAMKDEEPWQQTLPWARELTSRNIGQIWVHHTGHDETRSYGTKTREWQLDVVMMMEGDPSATPLTFELKFTKARERGPDNRFDFEPAIITLDNDRWTSTREIQAKGQRHAKGRQQAKDRALELLKDQITRHGTIPPACQYIPPDTRAVPLSQWRSACELGCISDGDTGAKRKAFYRSAKNLLELEFIGMHDPWVWIAK